MDPAKILEEISKDFALSLKSCNDIKRLEEIRTDYLGRKGKLNLVLKDIPSFAPEVRKEIGSRANVMKGEFEARLGALKLELEKKFKSETAGSLDVTLPGVKPGIGTRHPLTLTINRICDIFVSLGFEIAEGPEIESEFYNFEALNIPLDHPSRDSFDTFYVKGKYVLRSHTSNVQIRLMEKKKPPVQAIMPGRVYRPDAVDASHSFMFHQVEGLLVSEAVRFSDLKGILMNFCKSMFGPDIKMRMRPHFFPFTEPSVEVDISCASCGGDGCRVCGGNGWLEILGAGMVNPKVFEAVKYDTAKYRGFAFGMGVERIAMLLYGIEDIRLFYENDMRFLRQFN
jgi:phenylalanyl-tRNA synthetase alpha chain